MRDLPTLGEAPGDVAEPETPEPKPRIQYFGSLLTTPGARDPWKDSSDNPMSPAFVPLTERGESGRARWWARFARRTVTSRPKNGIFE